MLSTRACPLGVRVSRRRQPTSVTVESGTTRSDEVIEPAGPSSGRHVLAVPEHQPAAVADRRPPARPR